MIRHTALAALLALAVPAAFAQKREIVELQRDIANLTDQVRAVQKALDANNAELRGLVGQTLESSKQSTSSVAVLETRVKEQLAAPIAGVNTRLDQMATEFQGLRESVADLTDRMGRLQQQLEDISNAIKTIQAPPAPPSAVPGQPSAAAGPPPGMSAQQLYDSALRDRTGGQLDLALNGFQQYLQFYGTTELAPNAQFYIGQIHYDRAEFPQALAAFDAVLERFSENNKTPDAIYMKGMTLLRSGQRNEAAREFLEVATKFPRSEVADKARAQRKALGLSTPGGAPAAKPKRRR